MDTKDKNPEPTSPGIVSPDTALGPAMFEMSSGGAAATAPPDEVNVPEGKEEPRKSSTPFQDSLRQLRRDKRAMVSLGVIVFFILIPLIGPTIYQHIGGTYQSTINGPISPTLYHNPFHQELDRQDEFISGQYWLGTDDIGRDLLARLMQGMLVSLSVAAIVEIIDIVLGVTGGVLAGFYGGLLFQLLCQLLHLTFVCPRLFFRIFCSGMFCL